MSDFMIGFYCALTILGLVVFAIIYANEGRRMSGIEGFLSLIAILCWPLLALGISIAVFIQRIRKRKCKCL
jgi:hypothetical protein